MKNFFLIFFLVGLLSFFNIVNAQLPSTSSITINVDYNKLEGINNLSYGSGTHNLNVPDFVCKKVGDAVCFEWGMNGTLLNRIKLLNISMMRFQLNGGFFNYSTTDPFNCNYQSSFYSLCACWNSTTHSCNYWNWTKLDVIIGSIKETGAEPIISLAAPPPGMPIPTAYAGMFLQYGPVVPLITSSNWGEIFGNDFGIYSAEVVRHVNMNKGYNVKYWEILNEPPVNSNEKIGNYTTIFNNVQSSIHNVDPSVLTGSDESRSKGFLDYFVDHGENVGFFSFHEYDDWGTCMSPYNQTNTNNEFYPPNDQLGWYKDETIMKYVNNLSANPSLYTPKEIVSKWEQKHSEQRLDVIGTEVNLNSAFRNGTDSRQQNVFGATWYAAKIKSYILDGTVKNIDYFDLMSWDTNKPMVKYGGFGFGMINSSYPFNPYAPYWSNYLLSNYIPQGTLIYNSSSSNSSEVDILAVKTDNSYNLLLINKVNKTVTVDITISGSDVDRATLYLLDGSTYVQRYEPSLDRTIIYKSEISTILLPKGNVQTITFNGYSVAILQLNSTTIPTVETAVFTDKQNYNLGETVQINGINFSSIVDTSLQINDQNETIKFVDQDLTDTNGHFSSSYKIPLRATTGIYTIYASSPNEFAQVTFNVLGVTTTTTSTTTSTTTTTVGITTSTRPTTTTTTTTTTTPTASTTTSTTTTTPQITTIIGDGDGRRSTTTTKKSTTTPTTTSTKVTSTTSISKTTTIITTTTTIPSKKEILEPLVMLGIGIIIVLIVASLIIIIQSVHWNKGTVQKELIILMIAIVLIILLISLLPVQERKGMKRLSILDWFIKLFEWIFSGPKVAVVYNFSVSAQILDYNHNPTVYILPEQQYYVTANIMNIEDATKSAKFIVQIIDSSGLVVDDISSSSLTLNSGETRQLEVSYTAPDIIGDYTAQIFVWTDLASRRGLALAPSLDLNFEVVSQITSTTITTTTIPIEEINREHILNYLNYTFNDYLEKGLAFDLTWTIDSYDILGVNPPNRTRVIEFLNSKQSDEGTWYNGTGHYVPITAQILMLYNRSGVKPAKSLDHFFSTIDTWEKVNAHVNTYNKGNYWGGLWGYVNCYVVYKHEAPPWTQEFLNEANVNFSTWAYSNHQRTHLIGNLLQLEESIPRIDDVVRITLQQQNETDGSWDNSEAETVFTIQVLRYIRDMTIVDKGLIDSAINRGLEYVRKCYKTVDYQGKTYAGFGYTTSWQNPVPRETSQGIWALLNPQSDIWSRWFVTKTKSHSYIMDMPVFPEDTVPKLLQGHSEVTFGWMPWAHGICYDEQNEPLIFHISIRNDRAAYDFTIKNIKYSGYFDTSVYAYSDGVLTLGTTPKLIIDYHMPHNVTIVINPTFYINFTATYRGPPLWYSKTLDPNDMMPTANPNAKFGGYDAPIKIVGKVIYGEQTLNFNGYGDWEHVWFIGGNWYAPRRLWMILNDEKYYAAVSELKSDNDSILFHIGRFAEVGGPSYVFDDYEWLDDGTALPLYIELKGPIRDTQGNIKGNVDLKTDPQKARVISSIWVLYENISGNVPDDTFRNGTAWSEIGKIISSTTTSTTTTSTTITGFTTTLTSPVSTATTLSTYEQLLCTGTTYNPNIPEVQGSGWFPYGLKSDTEIDSDFEHAKELGLNVIRFLIFYDIPEKYNPPVSINPIDSRVINYIDLIITKAKKYNLKVMPVLLTDTVTPNPMLNQNIDNLKTWIQGIITKYKDEPTIYAWDVVNEPFVYSNPDHLSKTLALINYAKTLDTDTPITSGEGEISGEVRNAVDIISLHWYPYGNLSRGESPYQNLVETINGVKQYNKPIILQEFDMATASPSSERAQECFLFKVLDIVKSSGIKGFVYLNLKDYFPSQFIDIPGASKKSGLIRSDYTYKPAVNAINSSLIVNSSAKLNILENILQFFRRIL